MADLDDLLEKTSRTFALSIPRLSEPTRREVTVAYLLFRIADTFEDASSSPRRARIDALRQFSRLLSEEPGAEADRLSRGWVEILSPRHSGYRELLLETPFVLDRFRALRPESRGLVRTHLRRTAAGMAGFVARTTEDGELALDDLEDLRGYCYVVAGIVGEMLTELFLLGRPELRDAGPYLRARARAFGEGLQLVNVLKDAERDGREGRMYLPPAVDRARVFRAARENLDRATEYVLALQEAGGAPGLVAFNALPVKLAWATLEVVERDGPGAKISRPTVWTLVEDMEEALEAGTPVLRRRSGAGQSTGGEAETSGRRAQPVGGDGPPVAGES